MKSVGLCFLVTVGLAMGAVRPSEACSLVQSTVSISFNETVQGPNLPVSFTLAARGMVPSSPFCTLAGVGLTSIGWGLSFSGGLFDLAVRDKTPPGVSFDPALHYLVLPDIITQLSSTQYQLYRRYRLSSQLSPNLRTELDIDLYSTGSFCAVYPCTSKAGILTPTTATLSYRVYLDNALYAVFSHTLTAAERATLASVYLR